MNKLKIRKWLDNNSSLVSEITTAETKSFRKGAWRETVVDKKALTNLIYECVQELQEPRRLEKRKMVVLHLGRLTYSNTAFRRDIIFGTVAHKYLFWRFWMAAKPHKRG